MSAYLPKEEGIIIPPFQTSSFIRKLGEDDGNQPTFPVGGQCLTARLGAIYRPSGYLCIGIDSALDSCGHVSQFRHKTARLHYLKIGYLKDGKNYSKTMVTETGTCVSRLKICGVVLHSGDR